MPLGRTLVRVECSEAKGRLMTEYFRDPHVVSLRYRIEQP